MNLNTDEWLKVQLLQVLINVSESEENTSEEWQDSEIDYSLNETEEGYGKIINI